MTEHYYTPHPQVPHNRRVIREGIRGREFQLVVDAGVFSKGGVDFGTRLLAEAVEIPPGSRVLDMGCGYGPLGLAALSLHPDNRVWMVDINARAVELARENLKLNRLENGVVLQGDGFAPVAGLLFDCILMNPPVRAGKALLFSLYEGALHHLVEGGSLWLVIRKKQGAASTEKKLQELFGAGNVEEVERKKGYFVFRAQKKISR